MNNEPQNESDLLDAYLDALAKDPSAPPPAGLAPNFARFVRNMVLSQAAERLDKLQAKIWQNAFREAQTQRALLMRATKPGKRRHLRLNSLTAAAAILIFSFFLLAVLINPNTPAAQPTLLPTSAATATPSGPHFEIIPAAAETPYIGNPVILNDFAWSANRGQLAVASTWSVWLYQTDALDSPGKHLNGYDGSMDKVIFSPDGQMLASANENAVMFWDVAHAQATATLFTPAEYVLAFSPTSNFLATGETDNTIRLWDMRTYQQTRVFSAPSSDHTKARINSVAFSPDGLTLASGGSDNIIRLWKIDTGLQEATLQEPVTSASKIDTMTNGITALAFSPDGKTLASGSSTNWVRIWTLATKAQRGRADLLNGTLSIAFSPNSNAVAYTDGESAWMWEFKTDKEPSFLDKATHWKSIVYDAYNVPLALGYDDSGWRQWDTKSQHPLFGGAK